MLKIKIIFFLMLLSEQSFSCSCVDAKDWREVIDEAKSIYYVEVVSIGEVDSKVHEVGSLNTRRVSYQILRNIKGENVSSDGYIFQSNRGCALPFDLGERFIYIDRKDGEEISVCSKRAIKNISNVNNSEDLMRLINIRSSEKSASYIKMMYSYCMNQKRSNCEVSLEFARKKACNLGSYNPKECFGEIK